LSQPTGAGPLLGFAVPPTPPRFSGDTSKWADTGPKSPYCRMRATAPLPTRSNVPGMRARNKPHPHYFSVRYARPVLYFIYFCAVICLFFFLCCWTHRPDEAARPWCGFQRLCWPLIDLAFSPDPHGLHSVDRRPSWLTTPARPIFSAPRLP